MAFPSTTVLDDFNRADTGPPPSANWTGNWAVTSGGDTLIVVGNQLVATASGDAYWSAATFGPDSEAFCTVVTLPSLSFRLAVRLASIPNTNGYQLRVDPGASNIVFGRLDNRVVTQLGASLTQDLANGNKAGLEMIGSTLSYYHDVGSGWVFVDSRSDATYSAAGNIGVRINDTTTVLDDFGGGTVVAAGPTITVTPRPVVVDPVSLANL